ncbi:PEP-CTERM sorting domain-containing protein [Planctomycetota bacterium]
MKRVLLLGLLLGVAATPGWALPVLEFSPDGPTAGSWTYNAGLGVMGFNQDITVNRGASSNTDNAVGTYVYLPTMAITGSSGNYALTPLGSNQVRITNSTGTITYMTGNLGTGDLTTIGTVGAGYSQFSTDITNVYVTAAGQSLGSAALDIIASMTDPSLDFELALNGASNTQYTSFAQMIDGGYSGSGGFSGAMSVPEPTTVALLALGGVAMVRQRRRKTMT